MQIEAINTHAGKRIGQRGFTVQTVEAIYAYGRCKRRHGADIYFMDRKARRRAIGELREKQFARLEKSPNGYLVVGDQTGNCTDRNAVFPASRLEIGERRLQS